MVDSQFSRGIEGGRRAIAPFEGKAVFFPGGEAVKAGTRLVQRDLARTLKLIAEQGPKAFYEGPIADSLVAEEQRGGGIITKEDLRRYKPEWRTPIKSTYRGYTLLAMPPSSSGGITMTETLNILENFAPLPPAGSAQYAHLLAESFRRAFIDRNTKLGDPAFVKNPLGELTSKALREGARRADRSPSRVEDAGVRHEGRGDGDDALLRRGRDGNAVATTTTLNGGYGSGVWVRGGGFFMNNEMDDFAAQPGTPNMFGLVQGEANRDPPRQAHALGDGPDDRARSAGQAADGHGRRRRPHDHHGDDGGDPQRDRAAHDARRRDARAAHAPPVAAGHAALRANGMSAATVDSLRAMGHAVAPNRGGLANVNSILRVPGGWHGVNEPRSAGGAVGYDGASAVTGQSGSKPDPQRRSRLTIRFAVVGTQPSYVVVPAATAASAAAPTAPPITVDLRVLPEQLPGQRADQRARADLLRLVGRALHAHLLERCGLRHVPVTSYDCCPIRSDTTPNVSLRLSFPFSLRVDWST